MAKRGEDDYGIKRTAEDIQKTRDEYNDKVKAPGLIPEESDILSGDIPKFWKDMVDPEKLEYREMDTDARNKFKDA